MKNSINIRKLIACAALVSLNLLAFNTLADAFVWKVSKGNNYFYLGGTIHLLSADDHPLPEEFSMAYQDAGKIVLETDLVATQTPEFQSRFMAAMTYSDDRTLAGELEPGIYRKLKTFMASRQMAIADFSTFQPWGVALMITMLEYQRLGMMPNYGVDAYFNNRALADNKKIMSLETPDTQLRFLISMGEMDPNLGIEYTLRDLERLPEVIGLMKKSWRSGDLDAFAKNAFIVQMKEEFPKIYDSLITHRNNAWLKQLPSFIDDDDKEFVLVGAMHLSGKEGLLNQLKLKGFRLEQL